MKPSTFCVTRLTMLPQLGRGLPILSRRCRCGLLSLALIALVMPPLRGTPAAQQGAVDRQDAPGAIKADSVVKSDDESLKEFLETYRLGPRQNLKRIELPRPEGIHAYWKRKYPNSQKSLDQVQVFTFGWSDPDRLQFHWSLYGGPTGFRVRDLPRFLNMELFPVQIEGDLDLLNREISGDWIFREGVPAEQLIPSLEAILQCAFRLRITLAFREVKRDVVVARGRYRYAPLPGRSDNAIEIYGTYLDTKGTGGGGSGKFPEFLRWVGEWIERPVVSEVEAPPKENVGWHYNRHSPFTEEAKREDHDEVSVLKHLEEQTGFTFTREKKPIRVLFVEWPKRKAE